MKVIKRYKNRKLYDTEDSRYVTLGEVFNYVRGGGNVQVVNNPTSEDITSVTLLSAIIEQSKTENFEPETLAAIIRGDNVPVAELVGQAQGRN